MVVDVKVALVGPPDSGKSSLVKFLKGMNFDPAQANSNFQDSTEKYNETWGINVNVIEWDYECDQSNKS